MTSKGCVNHDPRGDVAWVVGKTCDQDSPVHLGWWFIVEAVQPEQHGEGYWYDGKKYWLVVHVRPDGLLTVITRRGKERSIEASDSRLRPARWWESLFFRDRFPRLTGMPGGDHSPRSSAA